MNNLDDLKAVWQMAKVDDLLSSREMIKLIKNFRSQKLRSKWLAILLSLMFCCLIIIMLVISSFEYWSTYLGGGLMVLAGLFIATTNIRSMKRFYQLDNCSNSEFLAFIEQTRQNQIFHYKKTMLIVVFLGSIGWGLYFFETIHEHTAWFIGVYAGFALYIAFLWFFVRPRSFRSNAEKLKVIAKRLQDISNQLK